MMENLSELAVFFPTRHLYCGRKWIFSPPPPPQTPFPNMKQCKLKCFGRTDIKCFLIVISLLTKIVFFCIIQKVCIDHTLVSIKTIGLYKKQKRVVNRACPEGKNMVTRGINIIIFPPIILSQKSKDFVKGGEKHYFISPVAIFSPQYTACESGGRNILYFPPVGFLYSLWVKNMILRFLLSAFFPNLPTTL
jgi:hypothetical protein